MRKVCEDWKKVLPATNCGPEFFDEFKMRASNVSAEVHRVKSLTEARDVLVELAKNLDAKKVVGLNGSYEQATDIHSHLKALGIKVYTEAADIRTHCDTADIGVSSAELGVAETGSVLEDGYSIQARLVSTLPPVHVVFLNSSRIVKGMADAFESISQVFNHGYLSFITGPSRTADIERVLTIGVHGPCRLVIIAVDEELPGGGAQ